jgi:ferritin-like metal-binding protein YciE
LTTDLQGRGDLREQLRKYLADAHIEIGGYELLKRVATRAGDGETAAAVDEILAEERHASQAIAGAFDEAVRASLRQAEVVGS